MTEGHKHRHIAMREDSRLYRLLRTPFLETANADWADRSRLVFGVVEDEEQVRYTLSLLGVLHGFTGLTLVTDPVAADGAHACRSRTGFNELTGHYCCDLYARWYIWDRVDAWTDGT